MYLAHSLFEGVKILTLDKETIKKTAREKDLEEIFLSTLFMNYLIVLLIYLISLLNGGFSIEGRALNPSIFYAMLMIYPFFFNLMVYIIYGLFGGVAELLEKKTHVKPLMSVGYHTAIVYSVLFYFIFLALTYDLIYGLFLITGFVLYFIYAMFVVLKTVYRYSGNQTAIVVLLPFLVIGLVTLVVLSLFPNVWDILFI